HLVEDLDPIAALRRVVEGDFDAADGILNMDESACLPARAVDRQRIADGSLDEEAVQHRAIVAVIVEAVDELVVYPRLFRMGAPDDALMQVRNAQPVILGV